jgi:hypothetical protein
MQSQSDGNAIKESKVKESKEEENKEENTNFYFKTEEEKEREKKYLQDIEDKRKKLLEEILAEESD